MRRFLVLLGLALALGCSSSTGNDGSTASGGDAVDGGAADGKGTPDAAKADTSAADAGTGVDTFVNPLPPENTNEMCKDGKDNDDNGYTDCDDFGCSKNPAVTVCKGTGENTDALCKDGKDNDNNGYTDCDDFGCSKNPAVTVCKGTGPTCGDGKCDAGETKTSCPKDCGAAGGPDSCVGKCGEYAEGAKCQCDDGCAEYDDCCADWDKVCKGTGPVCGNGKCESGETKDNCAKDCTGATGSCVGKCGEYAEGAKCQCDDGCGDYGDCCPDKDKVCGGGATCGDGKCEAGETATNCPKDCGGAAASCQGKCDKYVSGAPCQCDANCGEYKDCCSDYAKLCGGSPKTCLNASWQAELKGFTGAPGLAALPGGGFAVAAGNVAVLDALGAAQWSQKVVVAACEDPTAASPKCVTSPVKAAAAVAGPGGDVYAGGQASWGTTGSTWAQPVALRLPGQGTPTWAVAAPLAATDDQGKNGGIVRGGVVAGPAGGLWAFGARMQGGSHVPVVQAVAGNGAPGAVTTWDLSALSGGAPGGHSQVHDVAWLPGVGTVAAGSVGGTVLGSGGWQGGKAWVGAALEGGKVWQALPAGVDLATGVTLTADGAVTLSGLTTQGSKGGSDGWVGRLDATGKVVWTFGAGGTKDDSLQDILMVGAQTIAFGTTASKGAGEANFWLVSLDNAGKLAWEKTYGLAGSARHGAALVAPSAGGFLLAGTIGAPDKSDSLWLLRVGADGVGLCSSDAGSPCVSAPLPCDDGNACTLDVCDPAKATCTHAQAPEGLSCVSDNACAEAGQCAAGACKAGKPKADGTPCGAGGKCKAGACEGDKPVAPVAGELVFTELMPRSQAGVDDGEYIELRNLTTKALDLTGLELVYKGTVKHAFKAEGGSLTLKPGAHYVIGRSKDAAKNHGAPVDYVQTNIGLGNSGGDLALMAGKTALDKVVYAKEQVVEGVSLQLSKDKQTPAANDDAKNWCPSTKTYGGAAKKGTPGAANDPC